MNFSLITPTRRRIGKLTNFLNSVLYKTKDKDNIEVLIAYDSDDEWTANIKEALLHDFSSINLKMTEYPRSTNLHSYYNQLYKISQGKTLITLNDDSMFLTQDWDSIAQKKIDDYLVRFPDGIYYGMIDDLLLSRRHGRYCCFPFISRKIVEVIGHLQNELFSWGGADIYLGNIVHAIDRVIDIKGVQIDHMSPHNHPDVPHDDLYHDNMARVDKMQARTQTDAISHDLEAVQRYIKEFHGKHYST